MTGDAWRLWLFTGIALGAVVVTLSIPPVAQDPAYHQFADTRALLGLENFWNVVSNFAFFVVGLGGLFVIGNADERSRASAAEWVFCIGVLLIGPGSAWYHLDPTTPTLFWDRLPMSMAFMALLSALLGDALSPAWGRFSLWPLLLLGVTSVLYWATTEQSGAGDVRFYALVQFLPMVLIPLLLAVYGTHRYRTLPVWLALACYALAKGAEVSDHLIMETTGMVSGHTLKHLLAAAACAWVLLAFTGNRAPERKT